MNNILLIDENYIKNNSPIYDNLDPKIIRSYIFEAQNINYKYLLPTELYDDLFNQLEEYRLYILGGGSNPIEDEVDDRLLKLKDESKSLLLYYTLYNAAYSLYSRITNKGVTTQNSDYSETIDIEILEKMRKDWKHKAESYSNLLLEFLQDNNSIYPEYQNICSETNKPYSSPLYLGDEI
jgi:predicted CopG family antitoxin